jgi:transposase InsO family protein
VIEVRLGAQFWINGSTWRVEQLVEGGAVLCDGGTLRRMSLSALWAATALDGPLEDIEPVSTVLDALASGQRQHNEQLSRHIEEILASPPEIRPQQMAQKATELGVSVRTLQRRVRAYIQLGPAGLADARIRSARSHRIDPRFDEALLHVLADYAKRSTPTMSLVIELAEDLLEEKYGPGAVPLPGRSTRFERLKELSKGRHAFGSAKQRRSVAERPKGVYGRLWATRPGEYIVLDTNSLDVFAINEDTGKPDNVELTVAMDLFSRCVLGMRVTIGSTRADDVANVLYQCMVPPDETKIVGDWPYHGIPRNILVETEEPDPIWQQRTAGMPAVMPEAIVVDHGKQYLSAQVLSACARLGITVQPAIPHKPTDKPTVERFFRTLRQSLLERLPGYKGPDVNSRGEHPEREARYFARELEQIIREWIGNIYHRTQHEGLVVPELPDVKLCPAEMFALGWVAAGGLFLPSHRELVYEFLRVEWRTIQHYGVEIDGRRYNGAALNRYRNRRSEYTSQKGQWPFHVDASDVRFVYFRDPGEGHWHRLEWEHARVLQRPFSEDAAHYARELARSTGRHLDPAREVRELVAAWRNDELLTRREAFLARRLSAQEHNDPQTGSWFPASVAAGQPRAPEAASELVDLASRRQARRADDGLDLVEDANVFEQYYREHPDEDGLEVWT